MLFKNTGAKSQVPTYTSRRSIHPLKKIGDRVLVFKRITNYIGNPFCSRSGQMVNTIHGRGSSKLD